MFAFPIDHRPSTICVRWSLDRSVDASPLLVACTASDAAAIVGLGRVLEVGSEVCQGVLQDTECTICCRLVALSSVTLFELLKVPFRFFVVL